DSLDVLGRQSRTIETRLVLALEAIMEVEDPEVTQLELKYCEQCGALWLRLRGVQDVYCASCAVEIMELPAPSRIASKQRLPGNHKSDARFRRTEINVICGGGG